jgi:hypothetical protein
MNKDSLIAFRTSKELHRILTQVAKKERRSLSSMIELVLTDYLKDKKESLGIEQQCEQALNYWAS